MKAFTLFKICSNSGPLTGFGQDRLHNAFWTRAGEGNLAFIFILPASE